ncbi:hypothetical protein IVB30_11235 [Bradyrhizobium sp. 200]|uniref:hypothetical protein n=1 Tax=Bradyrhizobium sp. 200 TaxID=2782665 RepID=UPI00200034A7|nr:hypothetical protein [Bradyrhizobium sp. 200]UPJ51861.1 hypothetical protein IVB30_11235 [Bradyrhizobium sp. 200]
MSGNKVKLTNGDRWTAQQFLDHYFKPAAPSTPAIAVDMPWYMSDGPGRYYHPGMFPIIENTINRRDLVPGRYELWKLAPLKERDPSVKAGITHYLTDPGSTDYKTRALVFGDESARISGHVVVNPDGTKTFERVEIRPMDTDFDFRHNNWKWKRLHVELAREAARLIYDPRNRGTPYEMEYRGHGRLDEPGPNRGIGRVYHPFTDSQLKAALGDPGSAPPGLLPSFTAAPPPAIKEHLRYLDQANGSRAQGPGAGAVVPPFGHLGASISTNPNTGIYWRSSRSSQTHTALSRCRTAA